MNKFYGLTFSYLRKMKSELKVHLNSSRILLKRFNSYVKYGKRKHELSEERLKELREKYGCEERQFEELTVDKFKSLIKDDETAKKIELIICEYQYEKYTTLRVPSTLSVDDMKFMLEADEMNRRRRINYLYQTEIAKINKLVTNKEYSSEYWSKKNEEYSKKGYPRTGIFNNEGELIYGLWRNAIVSKISSTTARRKYNSRLITAALFNQKLILDLGFEDQMEFYEIRHLCKQISGMYSYNKFQSEQPFDINFCNVRMNMSIMQNIPKFIENYQNSMISLHEKSYLDLFPKDNLIYLSPDAEEPLINYNCDDIYIVGGLVDKAHATKKRGLTYNKAKNEGIRMARLPLDEYIMWKNGKKRLCINHVFQILHDWAHTRDMKYALKKNIPERNQMNEEEIAQLEARTLERYKQMQMLNNKMQK